MIVLILALVAVLILFLIYNGLVSKKNGVENALATVDVQLKMRYDLIPNLVGAAKSYMQYEEKTLTKLTEMRVKAMAGFLDDKTKAQLNDEISAALKQIMVAVENYPELKSSESFVTLEKSLNEVEAQIAAARRTVNMAVTDYNNALEMFPSGLVAKMMGLSRKELFHAQAAERENVDVGKQFRS